MLHVTIKTVMFFRHLATVKLGQNRISDEVRQFNWNTV